MSDASPKTGIWVTAAAAIGGFLIFVFILTVTYLPNRPAPLTQGTKTPDERKAILNDLRSKEASAATSYGWIDQEKGVVRLPIERAMQLTVEEIKARQ